MLRFYLFWIGSLQTGPIRLIPQSEFGDRFGAINKELREAYASLDLFSPRSAKVQFGARTEAGPSTPLLTLVTRNLRASSPTAGPPLRGS